MVEAIRILNDRMYLDLVANSRRNNAPTMHHQQAEGSRPIQLYRVPSVVQDETSWDAIIEKTIPLLNVPIRKKSRKLLLYLHGNLDVDPNNLRINWNEANSGGNLADLLAYTFRSGVTSRHVAIPLDHELWFALLASLNTPLSWLPDGPRKQLSEAYEEITVAPKKKRKKQK